jgi:hypothetical protein
MEPCMAHGTGRSAVGQVDPKAQTKPKKKAKKKSPLGSIEVRFKLYLNKEKEGIVDYRTGGGGGGLDQ